jgi:hypothetical protein
MDIEALQREFEPLGLSFAGLRSPAQCRVDWDRKHDGDADEIEAATAFLRECTAIKSLNRRRSSYGLKHSAERWAGTYISNGASLMAAHRLGLKIVPLGDGINARLNVSEKSIQRLEQGRADKSLGSWVGKQSYGAWRYA